MSWSLIEDVLYELDAVERRIEHYCDNICGEKDCRGCPLDEALGIIFRLRKRLESGVDPVKMHNLGRKIGDFAKRVGVGEEKVVERAEAIAREYLSINDVVNPDTLAKASLYLALKEAKKLSDNIVMMLFRLEGVNDRAWIYLAKAIENRFKAEEE